MNPRDLGFPAKFTHFRSEVEQEETILKLATSEKRFSILAAPTGCVSGDTVIQIARGSGIRVSNKIDIATEFERQNGTRRRQNITSYTRSLIGEFLQAQPIQGVVYSGIRQTLTLTLEDGKSIRATPDHQILTVNGWVKLENLNGSSRVIVDIGIQRSEVRKPKIFYKLTQGLKYHPYAQGTFSHRTDHRRINPEGRLYRVAFHRLVVEASLNGISTEDLINICRNDALVAQGLIYLDPSVYAVHHKDHNHKNNQLDNLEILTHSNHAKAHDTIQHLRHKTGESRVKNISEFGLEETYDLSCAGGHPNFVANGIVIHNSGKSLVYLATAQSLGLRTLVLVSTKILEDQLMSDFASMGLFDIRGHSNYPCAVKSFDDNGDMSDFACREKTNCQYREDVETACESNLVVTNYAHWFQLVKSGDPNRLGEFDLVVIDEAHNIHDSLVEHASIDISRHVLNRWLDIEFPALTDSMDKWISWAAETQTRLEARRKDTRETHSKHDRDLFPLLNLIDSLRRVRYEVEPDSSNWLLLPTSKGYRFSPIWGRKHAETWLFRSIPRVVLVSATISPDVTDSLGLRLGSYDYIEVDSSFPVSQRPFYILPTINVDYRMEEGHVRMLLSRFDAFISARQDRKGIIQCISYDRMKDTHYRSKHKHEMLIHEKHNSRDIIGEFKRSKPPSTLLSPIIEEGHDFADDYCRYQIIYKIPRVDSRDPLLKARTKSNKGYLTSLAVQRMEQMYGRDKRSSHDWAECIIFDSHFSRFAKQGNFHNWFKRSWRWIDRLPEPLKGPRQ